MGVGGDGSGAESRMEIRDVPIEIMHLVDDDSVEWALDVGK